MWSYKITSGALFDPESTLVGYGYSGREAGLNNPDLQNVPDVGPLPTGKYTIGVPYDDHQVGKFALPLIPDSANQMFKRSLFRIHGDNPHLNHTASHGCIILPRPVRELIAKSSNKELVVEP